MTYSVHFDNNIKFYVKGDNDKDAAKWLSDAWYRDNQGHVCVNGKYHDDLQRFIAKHLP